MSRENRWKDIWNKREDLLDSIDRNDSKSIFCELKRINGFDITDGGIPYESLKMQYEEMKEDLCIQGGDSAFEVGCGAGANLYLFQQDGIKIGGMDYSEKLIQILHKVFGNTDLQECLCGEAIECPTDVKYDAVFSNSVFSYFQDYAYAESVLEKMLDKSRRSIGLLDVHEDTKKEAFRAYRIKTVKDYEERYKDLPKLFYPRSFFEDFARQHNLEIFFRKSNIKGYWNNDFVFHCYMRRR